MTYTRSLIKHILLLCLFAFIISCVREDYSVTTVEYPKIVGNYIGSGKLCTLAESPSDTICSGEKENILKIVIPKLNSIRISDSNGQIDSIHLNYIQKSVTESGIQYEFEGNADDILYILRYNSNKNSIFLLANPLTDNQQYYTYSAVKLR